MITQQELQERFDYKDGNLIYKIKVAQRVKIGDIAGRLNSRGYIHIGINNKYYQAHRLVWVYHNADIPFGLEIDHINGVKNDNRISNLRLATRSENACNTVKRKDNTSGYKGVSFYKYSNKWEARIIINGKQIYLGNFDTAELASEAYKSAADKHHKQFANY